MQYALLECSPSFASYRARPLDSLEIDQHPDSARIWATIRDLRDAAFVSGSDEMEEILKTEREEAHSEGFNDCADILHGMKISIEDHDGALCFTHSIVEDKDSGIVDALDSALDSLAGDLSDMLENRASDLAAIAKARADGAQALAKLCAEIDEAAEEKNLDWRTRHDLRAGRYSDESLSRIMKKDELARIAVIAMRALFMMARA